MGASKLITFRQCLIVTPKLHYSCTAKKMSTFCRIAVLQLTSTSDKEKNREKCQELLVKAKRYGAQAAFLPEAFDFIGESSKQTADLAETLLEEEGTISFYRSLSKELDLVLSLGGFHEKLPNSTKLANTHVLIDNGGEIRSTYRKTHLFDVEIPEKSIRLKESDYVQAGEEIVPPVDLVSDFKVGLSICYDLRFPEISMALRRQGATILTYPSAFTVATGAAGHWYALLKARAIENQCYVIAAAQSGMHNPKRSSFGHACVVDPWGAIIAECPDGENVVVAELSLDKIREVRRNMPMEIHRRQDLYGLCTKEGFKVGDGVLDSTKILFGQHVNSGKCVVFQSRLSYVLVNKKPVLPGHLLVIPKRIAKRMSDLSPDEVQDLFMTAQKAQRLTESFHQVTSSTISIQDGKNAGQTVEHIHVHILPRKSGDFKRNDDIYDELEAHDKGDNIQWRTEEEMSAESKILRGHFDKM